MFQMGGIGPMLGQAHHFRAYAPEKIPYAIDRYTKEAKRLYGVIDRRLSDRAYHRRRLFDRRYRDLPLDALLGAPGRRRSPIIRTCNAGSTASPPGRPWSAGSRC